MQTPQAYSFRARLEQTGADFMPMMMVIVPEEVVEALGGKAVKRVVCTLNGHQLRRGLLPMRTGERYLMVSKALRKELNLQPGTEVSVTVAADPNPDQVDLPEELVEGLAEWPEAEAAFQRLTPGRQRNLVHYIEQAKRPETRAQRVVNLLHQLATGANPFRTPSEPR
jgi:antitoxin component of MazEF toxin-antitoxin module